MPIYVFVCEVCGREIEELRKLGDEAPPAVEGCIDAEICKMSRKMTSPGFKFVGEGWGGWTPSADGQLLQRQTKGKRKSARWGKGVKSKG